MYNQYNNYMDPENPIAKILRDKAITSREVSVQIKRKIEMGNTLTTTFKHLPAAWFRASYNSIKADCRIYPFKSLFKVNLTGMSLKDEGNNRYTLTNPEFEIEVKIIFY